jgi:elongation factor Ts
MMIQINEDPKKASKPDAIKEKMIIGKVNKYYTESA